MKGDNGAARSEDKRAYAFFDFDGTITKRDTLIDFIRYAVGARRFFSGISVLSPYIAAFGARRITNWQLKEKVFTYFFKGWEETRLWETGSAYVSARLPRLIRRSALERIEWHRSMDHEVLVVTASAEYWIKDWCDQREIGLIATQLEVVDGRVTGRLSGENCYGIEKVNRIRCMFPEEDFSYVYAYGDSRGDREMLAMAHERHLKYFGK